MKNIARNILFNSKEIFNIAAISSFTSQRNPETSPTARETEISTLWSLLKTKTAEQSKKVEYIRSSSDVFLFTLFSDIACPARTAIPQHIDQNNLIKFSERLYLHANKTGEGLTQRSITASMAPLQSDHPLFTIFQSVFWERILHDKPTLIDLRFEDAVEKDSFYPKLQQTDLISETEIKIFYTCHSVEQFKKTSIHKYHFTKLTQSPSELTEITRITYSHWPDQKIISLDEFRDLLDALEDATKGAPLWIHCTAGVGRTGTVITALILKEKIKNKEICQENWEEKLIDIILTLRQQRGPLFVQKQEQLELLCEYTKHLLQL